MEINDGNPEASLVTVDNVINKDSLKARVDKIDRDKLKQLSKRSGKKEVKVSKRDSGETFNGETADYYKKDENWDEMYEILLAHEHPIFNNATLVIAAAVGGEMGRVVDHKEGANVLEIGTGDGTATRVMMTAMEEGGQATIKEYVCLDPFEGALKKTEKRLKEVFPEDQHNRYRFVQRGIEEPIGDDEDEYRAIGAVDGYKGISGIFSMNYCKTGEEVRQMLDNIHRLLADDGVAVLLGNFYNPEDWVDGKVDQKKYGVEFEMADGDQNEDSDGPHRITVQLNSVKDPEVKSEKFENYIVRQEFFEAAARKAGLEVELINPAEILKMEGDLDGYNPINRIAILRKPRDKNGAVTVKISE